MAKEFVVQGGDTSREMLAEVEAALDAHKLQVCFYFRRNSVADRKFYTARRNGATKLWVKDGRWRIPIKVRFKDFAAIGDDTLTLQIVD